MENKLVDLRDTRFVLYEQLGIEDLCKTEKFADHSKETFEMIINTAEKLAINEFAPVNSEGDEVGCVFSEGKVTCPEVFRSPFQKYCEGGWMSLPDVYDVGGQNAPIAMYFACHELFYAANHALTVYMGLTHSAAKVIEIFGTDEQKRKYMQPLYEGRYSGTMDLTETQAGSDVGAARTKAFKNPDGTYSITGGKIFISSGENNLTENIVHIVLARIEGAPEGTRGLSCFIVPKYRVKDDGTLGESNDLTCAGVEHKMGIHGSPTSVLNFGDNGMCRGELLGPEQKGIVVMFHMMNEQRVLVGLQGQSLGSTAYLHALDFARERKQGGKFGSKDTNQVPIITHPDVRRNLMWMKSYSEGMRALILYTTFCMDMETATADADEKKRWQSIVEMLTPIAKAVSTDKGFDVCTRAIQVHGGYGFCKEYKVEQFARDCKITAIYEGTNGIQAIDLFGRKIRMSNGAAFNTLLSEMKATVEKASKVTGLEPYAAAVGKSISALEEITRFLLEKAAGEDAYLAYSWATPYLEIFGDIVLAWMFIWQAWKAQESMAGCSETDKQFFYAGKIATAKFYIGSVLPAVYGKIGAAREFDRSFLELGESIFLP
ncbi:MAG TPA: acyl-CoA dehydrogenase [Deltaproteobacteria bacterium]|nr:acyl-CoA dehydrogenase [Deltaproteobacteria bacterium]